MQRLTGGISEIQFVSPKDERTKDDPYMRQPDITRARTLLQWEPKVGLEEGLLKAIAYFRSLLAVVGK